MNVINATIRRIRIDNYVTGSSVNLFQIPEGLLITFIGNLDGPP
jgi:hypothetical protein